MLCHSMGSSMPGFPVLHYLLEFTQTQLWCRTELGKVQEEEVAFETSSIVTKRKLVVTKAAGLGVEGLVLGRSSLYPNLNSVFAILNPMVDLFGVSYFLIF